MLIFRPTMLSCAHRLLRLAPGLPRPPGALLLLAFLAIVVFSGACKPARQLAAKYPRADLDLIHRTSRDNVDRNPVIVIPGFAGSKLVLEPDGGLVWGAFFNGDAVGWKKRDGMRALALDVARLPVGPTPRDLAELQDDAVPTTMLERAQAGGSVAGIRYPVYSALVDTLERGGYVDGLDADAEGDAEGGREGETAAAPAWFGFAYDWRQDNVGNAWRLGEFIDRCSAIVRERRRRAGQPEQPVRFDVIAHSMGGLLARYYLRYGRVDVLDDPDARVDWAGAADIDRMMLVATPSFGTMKALREIVQGRHHPVLPTMHAAMLVTWTAVYQMLPRAAHPLWVDETGQPVEAPPLTAQAFRERGWGPFGPKQDKFLEWLYPDVASTEERRDRIAGFMDAGFTRAGQFHAALDRHAELPCPTQMILFAGDADKTLYRAVVTEQAGSPVLRFEGKPPLGLETPGDGTVARFSALADERLLDDEDGFLRSPIQWDVTIFVSGRHSSLLGNPTFQNNLLHLLLDLPPRVSSSR